MFSVRFSGLENLEDSVERLSRLDENVIRPGSYEWLQGLRGRLKSKPYPARNQGQTYVRTGNLANRWAVTGDSITNSAPYSEWVVGQEQAPVHRGRWWTAREVVLEEAAAELGDVLIDKIEDQWR